MDAQRLVDAHQCGLSFGRQHMHRSAIAAAHAGGGAPLHLQRLAQSSPAKAVSQTQTSSTTALSVGRTARACLRGVPPDLPNVWGPDADHCFHHIQRRHSHDFGAHRSRTGRPRASPRRAGHPCGMTMVRRRRGRVLRLSRIGIWQTNHRPLTPTISALLGEFAAMGKRSRQLRRGSAVFFGSPMRGLRCWGANSGEFRLFQTVISGETRFFFRKVWRAIVGLMLVSCWSHAVGNPIRSCKWALAKTRPPC